MDDLHLPMLHIFCHLAFLPLWNCSYAMKMPLVILYNDMQMFMSAIKIGQAETSNIYANLTLFIQ